MQWVMQDERLKVQLFRFVDVLPMLHTSDAVYQHLYEYLDAVRAHLPGPASVALGLARLNLLTRAAVSRAARLSAMDLARRFIAGTNHHEVLDAAERERSRNRAFTLDILGEAVISEREAAQFHAAYQQLIEVLGPRVSRWPENPQVDQDAKGPLPRLNLSIKLSALDCRFDAIDPSSALRRSGERFRQLLRVARQQRAFLNVDMESYEKKDLTLWLFQQVLDEPEFRDVTDVGIVIQCYLRDAVAGLGAAARNADLGATGEGGLLGLRDDPRAGGRMAGAGVRREVAIGRLF
jgi:RHH-type proline utilization regulon transcriptional repressor/proline dehydrogenase/delta 1-pyrroline-5-carboxylate dehydrogenase